MEEIWKPIPGFEGSYSTSNLGRIKNEKRGSIKQANSRSYFNVNFRRNGVVTYTSIHKLVALAFIGEPPKYCIVNHKDGDKGNNRVENLEYVTMSENAKHYHSVIKDSLKCPKCNTKRVSKKWNYCPVCGRELSVWL